MRSTFVRAVGALALLSMTAAGAGAASISIDDLTDTLSATVTGADPSTLSITIQNETPETLGSVDIVFSYKSTDPNVLGAGRALSKRYNIFDPDTGDASDRLSISLLGLTTTSPDDNNVSVTIGFASASGSHPFGLYVHGILLIETGDYQIVGSGLTDLDVQFRSDIEGAPGPIAGAGLPGLLAGFGAMLAWYRKRRAAAI